jgi:hypothetical protein
MGRLSLFTADKILKTTEILPLQSKCRQYVMGSKLQLSRRLPSTDSSQFQIQQVCKYIDHTKTTLVTADRIRGQQPQSLLDRPFCFRATRYCPTFTFHLLQRYFLATPFEVFLNFRFLSSLTEAIFLISSGSVATFFRIFL